MTALWALATSSAVAQPRATSDPVAPASEPPRHPPSGLGASLAVGWTGSPQANDGWVTRLDYDVLPVLAPSGTVGGVLGFVGGLEYTRGTPDWGLSMPLAIVFGVRALPVRATVGIGFNALTVDRVDRNTGVGLWSPLATVNVGLDVYGYRLGLDARISRRWQFGAPDFTQHQLAVFIGRTIGSRARGR